MTSRGADRVQATGGQIVADYLVKAGIPYVVGIPGHGCLGLVDGFQTRRGELQLIQTRHEQAAVHLADGYFRATGKPLAVFTSIGPGAINTAVGVATAYVDSTAVLVLTGDVHTYMFGRGVLQEIERCQWANFPRVLEPITKRYWQVTRVDQLPSVLRRALTCMMNGRQGPVLIDLPMDVQSDSVDIEMPDLVSFGQFPPARVDSSAISRAVSMIRNAMRPVILAGGGAINSNASHELLALAELVGAAVVTTMMGKGVFPESHPLYGWHGGSNGTTCGNALLRQADVILAVGCRFADKTCSSYRKGTTFSIPPTKLIQVDIDPYEIGKNYPVDVGVVGDVRLVLKDILDELSYDGWSRDWINGDYAKEISDLKREWFSRLSKWRDSDKVPVTISRCLKEVREFLDENAVVVSSSGNSQVAVFQEFPFYHPRTNITTGGFSTMGFTLPAAIGAKLACPLRQVVGILGDGDFLMTIQELATAVQYDVPVVMLVLNNMGWQAIADLQVSAFGKDRVFGVEFRDKKGQLVSPNLAGVAREFGAYGERIERPEEAKPALRRAFNSGKPAVIEVIVDREFPFSGTEATGWWDVPIPGYIEDRRHDYDVARQAEVLR